MRERIRKRLTGHRAETLERIQHAVNKTKSTFSGFGRSNSGAYYRAINEDNKTGFAEYMDQSIKFIRHAAPGSSAQYVDELWDGANKLKQDIMAKTPEGTTKVQLGEALDKLIERKVEDFELGYVEGQAMNGTTHQTVNIINSNISNSVLQITQSGKDTISKDTAQQLEQLVNSEEIKALPDETRLDVLDQVSDLVKEIQAPTTDKGKVHRALKRLGGFLSSVASKTVAEIVTKLAVAWAT